MVTWKNATVVVDGDEIEITTAQNKTFTIHIDDTDGSSVVGTSEQAKQWLADNPLEQCLLNLV